MTTYQTIPSLAWISMRNMILFLMIGQFSAFGQIGNKGIPNIQNFSYEDYKAGSQNWDIIQDQEGMMLFGNNYGLLEYNGNSWKLIVQPANKTVIRSLLKGKDGVVYVGAQNEFGYILTNNLGQKRYLSLLDKIPSQHNVFSDVWKIIETNEGMNFVTTEGVYRYSNDTIAVIITSEDLRSFSKVKNKIILQDLNYDIFEVGETSLKKIIDGKEINYAHVPQIYEGSDNGLLLVTENDGLLFYSKGRIHHEKTIISDFWIDSKIHKLQRLRGDYLAVGTGGQGLMIFDEKYKPVQWLKKSNGLQSNNIHALGTDDIGNLWVATDVGLDYVEIATPLYDVNTYHNVGGAVHSIAKQKDSLFVGTNSGVYSSLWNENENPQNVTLDFQPIIGLSGQVWKIYNLEGSIYACHHNGLYQIEGQKSKAIFKETGVWNLVQLSKSSPYYLQGSYSGIHLLKMINGSLVYMHKVKGFDETSRLIEMDKEGNIWMAHGYKGIFKLTINEALEAFQSIDLFTEENGFPTSLFINLFKVKGKILFGTEFGTYQYNYELDSMLPEPDYMSMLGAEQHVRYLKEDKSGNIWFVKGMDMHDEVGLINFYENDQFEVLEAPLQKLKGKLIAGFENITILDNETALLGTKNGFVLYEKSQQRNYTKPFDAKITEIKILVNDSIIYGQAKIDEQLPIKANAELVILPFEYNSIGFKYSTNHFEDTKNTSYSFFLDGFDDTWYNWGDQIAKSYTNLHSGTYTFRVKSKNIFNMESQEAKYTFTILPPWYWTDSAKLIYIILGMIIIGLVYQGYKIKIAKTQRAERETQTAVLNKNKAQYQEEKLETERELVALRNQKLEAEIQISNTKMEAVNSEVASSIMMVTQKNEVLIKVSTKLTQLVKKAKPSNQPFIKEVIGLINEDIDTEGDWKQFKIHFDKIHVNFLDRIKEEFPDITPKDLQLAAYLRLNLSSKEIGPMMNITVRSVEGCRYRLRKHLGLDSSINLSEYILRY